MKDQIKTLTSREPVALETAVSAAVAATIAALALVFGWSAEVVAALNGALAGWIVVTGLVVRRRVTPVDKAGDPLPPPKPRS
jgi:hypothetical protein